MNIAELNISATHVKYVQHEPRLWNIATKKPPYPWTNYDNHALHDTPFVLQTLKSSTGTNFILDI